MKRYWKEIIIIVIQLLMFYVFPLIAEPVYPIGMMFLITISTFILTILMVIVSNKKIKFFYPVLLSVLFIPSVWIYYNETALIYSVLYLVISFVGLLIGILIHYFFYRK